LVRTVVVPHGLSRLFRPAASEADRAAVERVRRTFAAPQWVLAVGQAAVYKNHDGVVRAFAQAFQDDSDVHLILVQRGGSSARAVLDLAARSPVADRVHVLSIVDEADLLALYRGALCLLHPSWIEGWGMPISEAMGAGCPVVTSDRSAMPEVAGGAALLV